MKVTKKQLHGQVSSLKRRVFILEGQITELAFKIRVGQTLSGPAGPSVDELSDRICRVEALAVNTADRLSSIKNVKIAEVMEEIA